MGRQRGHLHCARNCNTAVGDGKVPPNSDGDEGDDEEEREEKRFI